MTLRTGLVFAAAAVIATAVTVVACDRMAPTSPTAPASDISGERPTAATGPGQGIAAADVVFAGAGDIVVCGSDGAERTARILDRLPGSVFSLGDNVYPNSTSESLARCYGPTWGRHQGRTYATPGNHDWEVQAGAPYFAFFGGGAGPAGLGYYTVDLGAWRVLSLNSNVAAQPGSPQYEWVRRELATPGVACTLALWHHPVFSSGGYGNNRHMQAMWRLLDSAGVELAITAHEHSYERFAPQDADGRPDALGIRQFVVGTGGAERRPFAAIQPNSEARSSDAWGILRLLLRSSGYDWEFIPVEGQLFRDQGAGECAE
jgi:hypothetical protein